MAQTWTEIMGLDPYELQLSQPAGKAVAKWLEHRHPTGTAKLVARDTGLDPRTVENMLAGHLSGPTLTKLLLTYRWELGAHLVSAVVGETYEESISRELEEIANDRRQLEERERTARGAWARVRARRSVDCGGLRLVAEGDAKPLREDGRRSGSLGA